VIALPRATPDPRPSSFLIFLGTGGGRFATFRQARATGGLWFQTRDGAVHLDPGPGALIRALKAGLEPRNLSAIVLSHRHLDHCADINVMIEAMTNGGFERHGVVYAPADALGGDDPVVLRYCRNYLDDVRPLVAAQSISVGDLTINPMVSYLHGGVETFRFLVEYGGRRLALFVDGAGFQGADFATNADILVAYVVMKDPNPEIDHLSLNEVQELVRLACPKTLVLTHFGMNFLRRKPWEIATQLTTEWGLPVIAAWDNMVVDLSTFTISRRAAS
jgi:ribonuclease BN (tRNA processing enzyme)